jgi:cytochrome b6-f complex iron-sulfur subunit
MEPIENQTNKRREFLTKVCPTVAFAVFGVSFLEACSSDSTTDPGTTGVDGSNTSNNSTNNSGTNNSNTTPAYTIDGDTITADLSNAFFDNLKNVRGWMMFSDAGILLLRTAQNQILAFSDCCPHQGARTRWQYSNNRFTCQQHGNSYGTSQGGTANCSSGASSGNLVRYTTTLNNNKLVVTK